ncbi:M4 family metallopeptidase [Polluticoccus soli]|uniref:M4 family metallopeptidase n=1 Tax=Polluticoccus soli TaxID=3034150 RepID=UPI0023E2CDB5|nr:M4 family metallopeptidase [Flavipsychrobacter sp. JY13-12]
MRRNQKTKGYRPTQVSIKSLLLAACLSVSIPSFAQDNQTKGREYHGKEAGAIINGSSYVRMAATSPYPSFARMAPTARLKTADFLPWLRESVNTKTPTEFKLLKQEKDELGIDHYRYIQTFKGIPIDKSTYMVHSKNGNVTSFNGLALDPPANLSPTPTLTEVQGLEKAKQFIGAKRYKWEDDFWTKDLRDRKKDPNATYYPKAELYWYVNKEFNNYRLAYRYDIHSADPDHVVRIYVDAQTGAILQTLPLESNCSAASVNTVFNGTKPINTDNYSGSTYRLRDNCPGHPVFYVRDWNSATTTANVVEIENTTNTWTTMNERFGGTVLWESERCYRYYLNVHSRNSYDDAGGAVNGYINAIFSCTPPPNPCYTANNASMSFDGSTMKVGLSNAGTLANSYATIDIIGHEFTHAVTGYSSNLEYQDEPGGLNESFSDIFGEVIENWVFSSNDWLLGEERTNKHIRSMSNPKSKGQPDTYLGTNWYTGTDDNGGVHTNSGVQNFWFYLLTVGGTGTNDNSDNYDVSGIGIGDARSIAYRNNNMYLSQFSQYADAKDGAIQAAIDLYGECSNQVRQTTNAWYAVGLGEPFFDAEVVVTSDYNGRDVSCNNACDGAVNVVVTNGSSPTFDWDNSASTAQSRTNLCPGTYTVTVTNGNAAACTVTASATIENTPDLVVTAQVTSNYNGYGVSCHGGNDGTASSSASGGTPPYTRQWSNGQTTTNATGLSATTYKVVVTDANGCKDSASVTLTEPPALTVDAGSNQTVYWGYPDSSCATLTATAIGGGVPPLQITWSNGNHNASMSVCPTTSTVYYVTISDANGCSATDSVKVCVIDVRCGNHLDKVTICHKGPNGFVTQCVSLNTVANHLAGHDDQLAACGTNKACNFDGAKFANNTVQNPIETVSSYLDVYPNPFNDQTTIMFRLAASEHVQLKVYDVSGKEIAVLYNGAYKTGAIKEITFKGTEYPSGVYFLTVESDKDEDMTKKIVITR